MSLFKEHRLLYKGRASASRGSSRSSGGGSRASSSGSSRFSGTGGRGFSAAAGQASVAAAHAAAGLPAPVFKSSKQTPRSVSYASSNASNANTDTANTANTDTPVPGYLPPSSQPMAQQVASATAPSANLNQDEKTLLQEINNLPANLKGPALSSFAAFRRLSPSDQKKNLDALMTQAQNATAAQFAQDRQRQAEDAKYQQDAIAKSKTDAQANYDRMVKDTDFNKLKDIAKTNKTLSDSLAHVTQNSFVTNLAGSGIIARRQYEQKAAAGQDIKDITDATKQTQMSNAELLQQHLASQDALSAHESLLAGRVATDTNQSQTAANAGLFLDLFGNQSKGLQTGIDATLLHNPPTDTTGTPSSPSAPPAQLPITATTPGGIQAQKFANARRAQRLPYANVPSTPTSPSFAGLRNPVTGVMSEITATTPGGIQAQQFAQQRMRSRLAATIPSATPTPQ